MSLLVSSCTSDSIYSEDSEEVPLAIRSISCDNLLQNGDFETYVANFDCGIDEFSSGYVPPWRDFGTSDLQSTEGGTVCSWNCVRYAHARSFAENKPLIGSYFTEGLQQSVQVVSDPDIYYSLSFEATPQTSGIVNGTISAYFLDGAPLFGPYDPPNFSNGLKIVERAVDGPGCGVSDWPTITANYIYPDQDYDNFFVIAQAESNTYSVLHDNYELLCHSRLLHSIKVDASPNDPCTYGFSPNLLGQLSILQYEWDFGDGNSSTTSDPLHTYSQPGIYTVSLTVKDADGCCTTVRTVVTCQENPTFCSSHICWHGVGHSAIGPSCIVGMQLLMPDCSVQDVAFQSIVNDPSCIDGLSPSIIPVPTPVSGYHCEIKQLMEEALTQLNLQHVILDYDFTVETCVKGPYTIPGYFATVEGAQVLSLIAQPCNSPGDTEYNGFVPAEDPSNCFGC